MVFCGYIIVPLGRIEVYRHFTTEVEVERGAGRSGVERSVLAESSLDWLNATIYKNDVQFTGILILTYNKEIDRANQPANNERE